MRERAGREQRLGELELETSSQDGMDHWRWRKESRNFPGIPTPPTGGAEAISPPITGGTRPLPFPQPPKS